MLSHEKLDAYQLAIKFFALSANLVQRFPRGHAALADQLKRAALSVPLNIAEGNGKPGAIDKSRFYGIARGSAFECGALLDACKILGLADDTDFETGKSLLTRVVSMLTKMCR